MNELLNVFGCGGLLVFILILFLVIMVLIIVALTIALCRNVRFMHCSIVEIDSDVKNLSQASKRMERMCDAINQRTRAQSTQKKKQDQKPNKKPVARNNKFNKGQRKNYEKKPKDSSDLFSVRESSSK